MLRALSAADLLDTWEQARAQPPHQRALVLLAAACPESPPAALAQLSIGRRDAILLTLREWAFGPQLRSLATCPGCGEQLALAFDAADIRALPADMPAELTTDVDGYCVRFRLPNSLDLAAIAGSADTTMARNNLLARCLIAVEPAGELTDALAAAMAEQMALADPQADVQIALSCPACTRQWLATCDIASFLWDELDAWARRLLREVHTLAAVYHWHEAEILTMSPWRRQYYLELVQA